MKIDFSYDLDWNSITSVDFGIRTSDSSSEFDDVGDRIGGFSKMVDSPNGSLFSELLVEVLQTSVQVMVEAYVSQTSYY